MINYSLFILMKSIRFYKFNDAFNSFHSEFILHDVIY